MRITNNMMVGTFMRNLNNNTRALDQLQERLSTGKDLNRPSDDPVGLVGALRLRTGLTESAKYLDNVNDGLAWLQTTDIALGQVGDILQRVRELTISGASDVLPQQARDAIAKEVNELSFQLLQVSNTTHGDKFIFSGYRTNQPAFGVGGVYNGSPTPSPIEFEVGVNVKMAVNVEGERIFKTIPDAFQILTDIATDLSTGNTVNLSGPRIAELDAVMDRILSIRAEVGAKTNRLELTETRLQDSKLNLTDLLSKTEDANIGETITQLKMQENVYRASLGSGARIIQPTLMDFLR
ncbi:MAG: flagellar hook-associated protein FlgL [Clostridia bacterium]|nr:flagellar hook-associated protein FlgL [Clostridia bacterium]